MDEMEGWDTVLEFIKNHFNGFECEAYAEAERHIEQTFRCWGKLPGDEPNSKPPPETPQGQQPSRD